MSDSNRNKNGAGKGDLSRQVKRKNWDKGWEMAFGKGKKKKAEENRGKDEDENKKCALIAGKAMGIIQKNSVQPINKILDCKH